MRYKKGDIVVTTNWAMGGVYTELIGSVCVVVDNSESNCVGIKFAENTRIPCPIYYFCSDVRRATDVEILAYKLGVQRV